MARGDSFQSLFHGDPLTPAVAVDLEAVARLFGHRFARAELAAEALTHRSALDRQPGLKAAFPHGNERLEFLGDRVLSLAMADLLLRRFPGEREGELARRHAALVQAATLVEIAEAVALASQIVRGDGNLTPAILADAVEALLGAIYLDAGYDAAARCIERLWGERLERQLEAPRDPKTVLQEWAQARRLALPAYREIGREGPAHAPFFVIEVALKGRPPAEGREIGRAHV